MITKPVQVFEGDGDSIYTPIVAMYPIDWDGNGVGVWQSESPGHTRLSIRKPSQAVRSFCNTWRSSIRFRKLYICKIVLRNFDRKVVYECEKVKRVCSIFKRRKKQLVFEIELKVEPLPKVVQMADSNEQITAEQFAKIKLLAEQSESAILMAAQKQVRKSFPKSPMQCINDLIKVQPMKDSVAQIFHMRYINKRGEVKDDPASPGL